MSEVLDLLTRPAQDALVDALADGGFEREAKMQAEAIAALAVLARHPAELRPAAMMVISEVARRELAAHGAIECTDGQGIAWRLSDKGLNMTAAVVDAAVALESGDAECEILEVEEQLRQAEANLGMDDEK